MTIHVLHTPMHVHQERSEYPRWCFGCRKRLPGISVLMVCDDPMSYYGPHWTYRCDGCGKDRRLGFGMIWEERDQ